MKLSTYGRKNVGISFEGRVIQNIMQITSRQTIQFNSIHLFPLKTHTYVTNL